MTKTSSSWYKAEKLWERNKPPASSFPQPRLRFRLWAGKNPGNTILDPFLFSVASTRGIRGQGQLQSSSSHGAGRKSVCYSKTLQQSILATHTVGCCHCRATRRKDFAGKLFSTDCPTQRGPHCSLLKDISNFTTLHLICYCIWLHYFPPLPTLPSAVPLVLLLNLHNKAKSKERRGYMNIYRYINTSLLFLKWNEKLKKNCFFHFNVQKISLKREFDISKMKNYENTRKKSSCAMFYFECCLVQRDFFVKWNVLWWKCCHA